MEYYLKTCKHTLQLELLLLKRLTAQATPKSLTSPIYVHIYIRIIKIKEET